MLVEYACKMVKSEFENATTSKAVLNSSGNMELRQAYYKAVPTLPDNKDYRFEYTHTFDNGTRAIFSLNFYSINSFEGMGYLFNPMGPETQFNITDITSTTITAQEADDNTLTTLPNGKKWLMDYTIALGADNNLVITLTGSDDSTKTYFRKILFSSEDNPTFTYSTDTRPSLYTLVQQDQ